MMDKAKANLEAAFPQYKSQSERDWATYGAMILAAELGARSNQQLYEPMTFNLPGNKFTPDWLHILEDGRVVIVEVKRNKHLQSYRDSRAKLRLSAATHPWFTWIMAFGEGMDWTLEEI